MAKTRKPKYKARTFESRGEHFIDDNGTRRADTSANIYESMLQSFAFKQLSTRQKMLYIYCKAQYYGKRKPGKDFTEEELFQEETYFYLNHAVIVGYGLYTKNMCKEFYGDISELIARGFIKKFVPAAAASEIDLKCKNNRKNVYCFTAEWQEWTQDKETEYQANKGKKARIK